MELKKWWHDKIVYQIYPKSFKDSNNDGIGDIKGIIEKLDYLKDLGVDILWLTPFYKSPMEDNGYDVADYLQVNDIFGSNEDMDTLIEECKKRDMYIMIPATAARTNGNVGPSPVSWIPVIDVTARQRSAPATSVRPESVAYSSAFPLLFVA